jgi:hypothetical protein
VESRGWRAEGEEQGAAGRTPTSAFGLPAGGATNLMGQPAFVSTTKSLKFTVSVKYVKKSAPRRGKATAANKKDHLNLRPPNCTCSCFQPQQAIGAPLAEVMAGPVAGSGEE